MKTAQSRVDDSVRTLRKAEAEALLTGYDTDPVGALTAAVRIALDLPEGEWTSLIRAAGFPRIRSSRLQAHDPEALDELAAELNELRGIGSSRLDG